MGCLCSNPSQEAVDSIVDDKPIEASKADEVTSEQVAEILVYDLRERTSVEVESPEEMYLQYDTRIDEEESQASPRPSEDNERKRRMSRSTHHSTSHEYVRDVVTHILGRKKDQDRAVCVPDLLPGVLYAGVFDGHGRNGEITSELATTELPRLIQRELTPAVMQENRTLEEKDLVDALNVAYDELHSQLDAMYEENVYKNAVQAAVAQRKNENGGEDVAEDDIKLRMPQDGGTTATSVIVAGGLIIIGWVGDSRAVLARRSPKKRGSLLNRFSSSLKTFTLTQDHNVAANNNQELARVAESGGEVFGKHLGAGAVEGMLQLTRSLGDSPFHRTGLVVAKPEIISLPLHDDRADPLLFLLVASDGLWDHFSNKEALWFVYRRLKKLNYAGEAGESKRSQILLDTARALETEVIRRCIETMSHSDDITIMLMTFTKGWKAEPEEPPKNQS